MILFDSDCAFCTRGIHFVFRRDPHARFLFAPGAPAETLILIDPDGTRYERSTAALRIARGLRWPWPLASAFLIVPRRWRDAVYDAVARRRHRLGGTCPPAPPGAAERMLDADEVERRKARR